MTVRVLFSQWAEFQVVSPYTIVPNSPENNDGWNTLTHRDMFLAAAPLFLHNTTKSTHLFCNGSSTFDTAQLKHH